MHQDRLLKGRNFVFYPLFYPFPPIFRPFSASGRQESRERGQKSRGKREKIEKNRGRWGNSWLGRTWQVTDFLQRVLVAVAKQRPQRPLQFAAAAFLKRAKLVDPVLACEKPEPTTGRGASVFPVQPLASLCRTHIYHDACPACRNLNRLYGSRRRRARSG